MFFAAGETVMVKDAAVKDRNGDPISTPIPRAVDGVGIELMSTRSNTERRNTSISEYRLFFPAGDPIGVGAEVQLPNDTKWCPVTGKPHNWHSPLTGWEPGVIVLAERVE